MKKTYPSPRKPDSFALEALEGRLLMSAAWNRWTIRLGIDQVYAQFPWLDGSGHGVAVIDRGINYYHPNLGGDADTQTPSPRIVNVYDYEEDDDDPFPETDPALDPDSLAGHGTGVAGLLVAFPYEHTDGLGTFKQQGMLQGAKVYNLRESNGNGSQASIRDAMEWVLENHEQYNITAVNLTDFIGTSAPTPVYDAAAKALWDAGIWVVTPVANNWLGDAEEGIPPRTPISFPGASPWVFAMGGVSHTTSMYNKTQRGEHLDLLGPSKEVTTLYYTGNQPDIVTNYAEGNSWGVPMATSAAVMIQQIDPTVTPAEIMQILQDSGVAVVDPDPVSNPDGTVTYKRLHVLEAIKLAYTRRDDSFDQAATPNDSLANAGTITLAANGSGSATGLKLLLHDHDYYRVAVSAAGAYDVKINYAGTSTFPGGQLLDANGAVVATIGQNGLTNRALTAGTYYVHLFNETKALKGEYSIAINKTAPAVPGDNGSFNGIQIDAGGKLHFAWFDEQTDTLKFATRSPAKVWSTVTSIDNTVGAGQFVSLKLDKNGLPGVAYYAAATADLKYAHFNGTSWNVETVSSKNVTGSYPSLQFNGNNRPVIAYYHGTGGDLRFATRAAGGWTISAVDTAGDVGRYANLALNPATGRWAVAYESTTAGGVKYASQNKNGTWSSTLVDAPGVGTGHVSLAFDKAKNPAFSYYDGKRSDLRLARFASGKWSVNTIAANNSVGLYNNLIFDPADNFNPVVYYYNRTGDKLTVARGNAANVFGLTVVKSAAGRHNHVALDKTGAKTVVYQDSATGDLKFL